MLPVSGLDRERGHQGGNDRCDMNEPNKENVTGPQLMTTLGAEK